MTSIRSTDGRDTRHLLEPGDVVVAVTTRHLFGLQQVTGSVRMVSGLVRLDARGRLLSVEAELDAASLTTGSRSRDRAVASPRLLNVDRYPYLVFRSTGATEAGDGSWQVQGSLTARGVTAPTVLVVRPAPAGRTRTVTGTARIDRFAHGITAGRGLAARHLDVHITVSVCPTPQS